jgi:photosystem II stability/assembly factor-like uncharacterized protein
MQFIMLAFWLLCSNFLWNVCCSTTTIVRTDSPPDSDWKQVAMDNSGKVQYALSVQYSLFLSVDYGYRWELANAANIRGGLSIACDNSGQLLLVGSTVGMFISDDYGKNVDIVDGIPYGSYIAVSYSGDGKYLGGVMFGGGLYMSSDFGESWTMRLPSPYQSYWRSLAINGNGQNIFLVPSLGDVTRSIDGGVTWSNNTISAKDWTDIDVDDSGNIVIASSVNGVFQSTDAGDSWQSVDNLHIIVEVISQSIDGKCIAATGNSEPLMYSSDSGVTWRALDVPSTTWSGLVVSQDCQFILLSVENGGLFLSTSEGADWTVHLSTCDAASGYSNGDCRSCNIITSPEGRYVNDGSELYCVECPKFTVTFDSQTCTNPCTFPYVPTADYFSQSSQEQCTQINFNISLFSIVAIIVIILALYISNLAILFIHVPKLSDNHMLAFTVIVVTALPPLDLMSDLLFLFTSTLYDRYIMIACIFFVLHPIIFIIKDFWYKRTERHMQVRIIGESFVGKEVWEWIQYHRLVTDQFASFIIANLVFCMITFINLVWIIPMLGLLYLLYSTKLYAFSFFAKKWHGWWSGYYETSIPLVMTWIHGRANDYIIDIHFFHEHTIYGVLLESLPLFGVQLFNAWKLREVTSVLIFSLIMSTLSALNLVYRAIYYRWIMSYSLKETPTLLHGLNDAAADDTEDGASPIRKSTTSARDGLRYSVLNLDNGTSDGNNDLGTTGNNKDYTSVYQRRQFRHRQMALRRDHVRAKMKDADVAWERRMRQARFTIQRRLAQIQAIVNQQQQQQQQQPSLTSLSLVSPSLSSQRKSITIADDDGRPLGDADALLQPRESFTMLQRGSESSRADNVMQTIPSLTFSPPHDTNLPPSFDMEGTENVDLLVRDIDRTLKSLDEELAQFLSEEIESRLVSMAIDIRRKSSMIPATASERGSFS